MASDPAFANEVTARLTPMGPVVGRRMFGGYGVFLDGLMFGLIAGDTFFLKVDDGNRDPFEEAGMGPFAHSRKGKPASLSYWQVPPDVFDAPDDLIGWATEAHAVARRAAEKKKR